MKDIEEAIKKAKQPGGILCPECRKDLYSPIDKLSLHLYRKCLDHLNSSQENNIFIIAKLL